MFPTVIGIASFLVFRSHSEGSKKEFCFKRAKMPIQALNIFWGNIWNFKTSLDAVIFRQKKLVRIDRQTNRRTDRQTDRTGKQKNNDERIENNNNKWRDTWKIIFARYLCFNWWSNSFGLTQIITLVMFINLEINLSKIIIRYIFQIAKRSFLAVLQKILIQN